MPGTAVCVVKKFIGQKETVINNSVNDLLLHHFKYCLCKMHIYTSASDNWLSSSQLRSDAT